MQRWSSIFISCFLWLWPAAFVYAQERLSLHAGQAADWLVDPYTKLWHQMDGTWEAASVVPPEAEFLALSQVDLKKTHGGIVWVRFEIENKGPKLETFVVRSRRVYYPIVAYRESAGSLAKISSLGLEAGDHGDKEAGVFSFPVSLNAGEAATLYLQLQRKVPKSKLALEIWTAQKFQATSRRDLFSSGILLGLSLLMLSYNSFLFLKLRRPSYLYYSLFVCFFIISFLVTNVVLQQFIDSAWLRQHYFTIGHLSQQFAVIFACLFAVHFLQLGEKVPQIFQIIRGYVWLESFNIIFGLIFPELSETFTSLAVLLLAPLMLGTGLYLARKGSREALFYSIGWGFLILGNNVRLLLQLEVLPASYFTEWAVSWTAAIEMIVLSFALSDQIRRQEDTARQKIEQLHGSLRQSHEALEASFVELQRSEEARTRFFHNTSHELRTPLNGILGYLSLMLRSRETELSESQRNTLHKIQDLGESLKVQINTILELAQAKRGDLRIQAQNIALEELRLQIHQLADGLCLHHRGSYFSSELLLAGGPEQMITDGEKVFTILRNLVGNAIKFAAEDRANKVHLLMRRHSDMLEIQVSDSGIGIPAAQLERVFQEFYQLEGAERRAYEGSGLGLSLVKTLVEILRGRIKLVSTEGAGSCFTIFIPELSEQELKLPVSSKDMHIQEFAKSPDRMNAIAPSELLLAGSHIFVIDDHKSNCEVLEGILSFHGATVNSCQDGRQALELMEQKVPEILLLDMMMPHFSGHDVMAAMRKRSKLQNVPIVVITARAGEQERLQSFYLGADDYLTKPIVEQELILRVRNLLARIRLSRQIAAWQEKETITLLGTMLEEVCHELQRVSAPSESSEALFGAFPIILSQLAPAQSHWVKMSDIGMEFDLDLALNHLDELPFTKAQQGKIPSLRIIRYYLGAFAMSEEDKLQLWNEILSWEDGRQEAFAGAFQVLSRTLTLESQSHDLHQLLTALLVLCRPTQTDHSCDLAQVLEQTSCLIRSKCQGAKASISLDLSPCAWPLSSTSLMQILLRLLNFSLDLHGSRSINFRFKNTASTQAITLELLCDGLILNAEQAQAINLALNSDVVGDDFGMGLAHAKRIAQHNQMRLEVEIMETSLKFCLSFVYANSHKQSLLSA